MSITPWERVAGACALPVAVTLGLLLCGCTRSYGVARADAPPVVAHAEPVCLLKSPMPSAIKHKLIGEVSSSKQFYGGTEAMVVRVANEARKLGADAIVSFQAGHSIGAFAWARPYAFGNAVKVENRADLNCIALGGEWR